MLFQGYNFPPVVDAGPDVTLVDYTTSAVLQGQVQESYQRIVGWKSYELKDHLGNVRVVVGDEKLATLNGATLGLRAAIRSYANYYPFGMNAPGGNWSAGLKYRYGFNGKEQDKDFLNNYDYGFRIYNPTIARFLSVDPLTASYPWYTPYQFAGNNPIKYIDLDGGEKTEPYDPTGSFRQAVQEADKTFYDAFNSSKNTSLGILQKNAWAKNWDFGFLGVPGEAVVYHRWKNNMILNIPSVSAQVALKTKEPDPAKALELFEHAIANTAYEHSPDQLTDIAVSVQLQRGMTFSVDYVNIERDLMSYNDLHRWLPVPPPTDTRQYEQSTNFVIEVKTVAKESMYKKMVEGVQQLVTNPRVTAGGVSILVVDKKNFIQMAASLSDDNLDELAREIRRLEILGGGLMLEQDLNSEAVSRTQNVVNKIRAESPQPPPGYFNK